MKMRIKRGICIWVIGIVCISGLLVSVVYLAQSDNVSNKYEQSPQNIIVTGSNKQISYNGKTGKTALKLLENIATVEFNGLGEMAYITAINGIAANANKEFWSFYVNNELASVGAGSYITNDSDKITWKLVSF